MFSGGQAYVALSNVAGRTYHREIGSTKLTEKNPCNNAAVTAIERMRAGCSRGSRSNRHIVLSHILIYKCKLVLNYIFHYIRVHS